MERHPCGSIYPVGVFLIVVNIVHGDVQDFMNLQHRRSHSPDKNFGYGRNSALSNPDESQQGPQIDWNRIAHKNLQPLTFHDEPTEIPIDASHAADLNITWDASHWTERLKIGPLTAIDFDQAGNVAILSRGGRIWGRSTFDNNEKFDCANGAINQNTIHLFDKYGKKIVEWGKNMFYLPHGITIDTEENYWITDVALHQVFKFNAKDVKNYLNGLNNHENEDDDSFVDCQHSKTRFDRSIIKPSMILGEAFEPGHDNKRFCKPTAVAVAKNGDFFVSDGYCNSRIVKFNKNGERILQWGRTWSLATDVMKKSPPSYAMFVPHSLALDEENNVIYVADRENGRVVCYSAENGSFHREYKNPLIGTKVYAIDYANGRLYIVNGQDIFSRRKFNVRGFVVDVNSGKIVAQLIPGKDDMLAPHDITVSPDGNDIYVVELDAHRVYRFFQGGIAKVSDKIVSNNVGKQTSDAHQISNDAPAIETSSGTLLLSIVISSMLFIGLCLVVAAVVAKCQKRGCLLSVRKRGYWKAESRENFKLSSLLETRQGKSFKILDKRPNTRDFSKLNTEPETSEDEGVEDSLVI